MSIEAKAEGLLRVLGMGLLFLAIMGELIVKLVVKQPIFIGIMFLCFSTPWLLVSFGMKLEKSFVYENLRTFIGGAIICSLIAVVGAFFYVISTELVTLIMEFLSIFLLLISWHFSLTIEKKYKIVFLGSSIGYILLKIIQIALKLEYFILLLACTVGLGTILIFGAEWSMRRKTYLNYI